MKTILLRKHQLYYLLSPIILVLLLSACATHTPPNFTVEERIDGLVEQLNLKKMPGCVITVLQHDSVIYSKGAGLANLETKAPNTPSSLFDIGSIAKSFTAGCIIKLVTDGQLSLNATVGDFFPDLNEVIADATIEQLLHHTSGIRDNEAVGRLISSSAVDPKTGFFIGGDQDHVDLIKLQKSLNYEHGHQYMYNNTGYWLLGQIVEKVSGTSLADFAKQQLFSSLGMTATSFGSNKQKPSTGYHTFKEDQNPQAIDMRSKSIGDGGTYSTSEDLAKWTQEMCSQKILGKAFWKLMSRKGVLNNAQEITYGGGIFIKEEYGNLVYSHGGRVPGYFSMFQAYPKHNISIVVLTNHTRLDAGQLTRQIANILIPKEAIKPIDLSSEELKKYEGEFFSDQLGWLRETKLYNDTLFYTKPKEGEKFPIFPIGNHEFLAGKTGIMRFAFLPDGKKILTLINPGMMDRVLEEMANNSSSSGTQKDSGNSQVVNPEKYIGEYKSEEYNLTWKIYLQDEQLNIDVNSFQSKLAYLNKNSFTFEGVFNIHFIEDSNKQEINGFLLDFGKAKNIKYSKI